MRIKGKQLEDTLRTSSDPFTQVHASEFVGAIDGAVRFKCKNDESFALSKGQAVYISGVSGDVPLIKLADADDSSAMPGIGLTSTSANINAEVYVVSFGNLTGLDTASLGNGIVGSPVYVSNTAGGLTVTPPSGSSSKLQNIGQIVREHGTEGIIKVGGAGRTAATPNLDSGKFFIGNGSNQSSESSYQLPTSLTNNGILVANSDGSSVVSTGVLSIDTANNTINADDNVKLRLGTGNDFEIFHDGSKSVLKDNAASGGSNIKYLAGTQTFQNKDETKTMAVLNASGSVDLHHNGVKKFETTSTGVQTVGTLNINGAYSMPTSDGSNQQILQSNGSGSVSFVTAKSASFLSFGEGDPLSDQTSEYELCTIDSSQNGQGYRMPISGEVTHMTIQADCSSVSTTTNFSIKLYKNGSATSTVGSIQLTTTGDFGASFTLGTAVSFNAGDRLSLYAYHSTDGCITRNHTALIRVVTDTY